MLVHPDRCAHNSAEDAFAAASQAYDVLRDHGERLVRAALLGLPDDERAGDRCAGDAAAEGGGATAMVPAADVEEALRQTVWNQNRLAVQAVVVPPGALLRRRLLHPAYQQQFAPGSSLAAEPLLFLPVADIPTLKKRRRLLMAPLAVAAAASAAPGAAAARTPAPLAASTGTDEDAGDDTGSQALQPWTQEGGDGGSSPTCTATPRGDSSLADASSQEPLAAEAPPPEQVSQQEHAEEDEGEGVEGLLLVTARTALWGRFPLNGTYFQVGSGAWRDAWTAEPVVEPAAAP